MSEYEKIQEYTVQKGNGACPWCGARRNADCTFPVPMIFKCSWCGGMWVMTTPPNQEKKEESKKV